MNMNMHSYFDLEYYDRKRKRRDIDAEVPTKAPDTEVPTKVPPKVPTKEEVSKSDLDAELRKLKKIKKLRKELGLISC